MISKTNLRQTFIDLMKINEIYPNEKEVIDYTTRRLSDAGVRWQLDSFQNIIVKVPGTGEAIMLSTHLDIPEPAPQINFLEEGDTIKSDGKSILGADPKTGLAILIEFLIEMNTKDHSTHAPIEAILTRGEETGLHGAINCDYPLISAKMGMVLDEDGPVTQVVTRAPAFIKIDAEFVGKIVHPREPELGINALQMACEALMSLSWGYSTKGVTWNVGMFEAGTARNSVPGSAKLKAELRSFDTALVVSEGERIVKVFNDVAEKYKAKCIVDKQLEFEGYNLEKDHPLFSRLERTFSEMNLKPNYFETFGGSDANIFNAKGIRSVPIGSGYYNAHQYTEEAHIDDMLQICEFLEKFLIA